MKQPPLILLIEDNPADVLLIQLALKETGVSHRVRHFESGAEAVRQMANGEANLVPAAILMDLKTPRSDGFEVLAQLRQMPRLAKVPIAILTSSRARSDSRRAEAAGARYIEKPSQLRDFIASVGQAIKEMLSHAA